MHNKKSIELSLNFIVILIISLVIFGFGVMFISKLFSQATELQQLTITELDDRIGNLVCEGSERVCIGIDRKTIKRTKFDIFGLRVVNILYTQNFSIEVKPSNPMGFKRDKTPITSPNDKLLIINPSSRNVEIEKNEEKNIGIGIQVPSNAVSGTYIFNIEIKSETGEPYSQIQKLYVDVP